MKKKTQKIQVQKTPKYVQQKEAIHKFENNKLWVAGYD